MPNALKHKRITAVANRLTILLCLQITRIGRIIQKIIGESDGAIKIQHPSK